MAKKPSPQTPGGKGKGGGPPLSKAGGGWVGKAPHTGGPLTPGGGHTGAPAHRPHHHHARHHPKATHHPKAKAHPKRKLAGTPLPGAWILGGNDAADNCAAVAVANALLVATGHRVPDAELLRIHSLAGPLSIADVLDALTCEYVIRISRNRRSEAWPTRTLLGAAFTELQPQPGDAVPWPVVAGLATPHGPHAGLLLPGGGLVTWGGEMALPDDWDVEECWAVTW